jgi:hypothetical protein
MLSAAQRRDVQRRLTCLGFATNVNGEVDDFTRVGRRALGYPQLWLFEPTAIQAITLSVRTAAALVSLNGHMTIRR